MKRNIIRIQIKARGFTFDAWSAGPKERIKNSVMDWVNF